jgi:antitoxin ParD1/3/4
MVWGSGTQDGFTGNAQLDTENEFRVRLRSAALDETQRCRDARGELIRPPALANFGKPVMLAPMTTMNISLPETLKSFVDEQVNERGYGTSSEYVRELIRRDQQRQQLRALLLEGAASGPTTPVDGSYFESLRTRVRNARK